MSLPTQLQRAQKFLVHVKQHLFSLQSQGEELDYTLCITQTCLQGGSKVTIGYGSSRGTVPLPADQAQSPQFSLLSFCGGGLELCQEWRVL